MAVSTASFCISGSMSALLMMTRLPVGGVAAAAADEGFRSSELSGFIASAPWMLLLASSLIFFFFSLSFNTDSVFFFFFFFSFLSLCDIN